MPMANNLEAHQTYLEVWQRALESPKGLRVRVENPMDYRARLYNARTAERRHNKKVYPEDHVLHGRSYYDAMMVRLDEGAVLIIHTEDPQIKEICEL